MTRVALHAALVCTAVLATTVAPTAGSGTPPVSHVQRVRCTRDTYALGVDAGGGATLLSILVQLPVSGDCTLDCEWIVHAADPGMSLEVYIPIVHAVGDTPVLSMHAPRAVPPFAVSFDGRRVPVFAGSTLPGRVVVAGPLHLNITTTACADWRALVNVYPTNQTQGTPRGPPPAGAPIILPSRPIVAPRSDTFTTNVLPYLAIGGASALALGAWYLMCRVWCCRDRAVGVRKTSPPFRNAV